MIFGRSLKSPAQFPLTLVLVPVLGLAQTCLAQDNSGSNSWAANSQQADPGAAGNPTRSSESHTEANGRVIDKTSVETLGPDGRYIPYSDTEKESVRVNDTTVRNIERTFGRDADGHRVLIQEKQEESRSLPDGEQKVVRTTSNPDANGALQVIQRELVDSKQISPGVRDTKTTVFSADGNGGLAPTVQVEEREKQSAPGTVEFKKSTLLSDGTGHWNLSEVREGATKEESGQGRTKEERVLRPDGEGKLAVVERTVSKQSEAGPGEKRETVETYSVNVPGSAGDNGLQLVRRENTVHRATATGEQTTTRQVERPNPGAPGDSLHVTEEAIDIVRPGGNGVAEQKSTILTSDPDGRLGVVWIDVGKTNNPSAIQVDTSATAKPK